METLPSSKPSPLPWGLAKFSGHKTESKARDSDQELENNLRSSVMLMTPFPDPEPVPIRLRGTASLGRLYLNCSPTAAKLLGVG